LCLKNEDLPSSKGKAPDWLARVYGELRSKAQLYLNREHSGHTLDATALVHEAYIKLAGGQSPPDFEKTAHFYAAAAEAMQRILVDHARPSDRGEDAPALQQTNRCRWRYNGSTRCTSIV
jgi:hypothetical protein